MVIKNNFIEGMRSLYLDDCWKATNIALLVLVLEGLSELKHVLGFSQSEAGKRVRKSCQPIRAVS